MGERVDEIRTNNDIEKDILTRSIIREMLENKC